MNYKDLMEHIYILIESKKDYLSFKKFTINFPAGVWSVCADLWGGKIRSVGFGFYFKKDKLICSWSNSENLKQLSWNNQSEEVKIYLKRLKEHLEFAEIITVMRKEIR